MKILVTGSRGFIGRHVSAALVAAGHAVVEGSRQTGFDFNRMLTVDDWLPRLDGIDAVINCVGIIVETPGQSFANLHTHAPIALFRACEQANVTRVIQVSALGADAQAFTPYQLSKKTADDVLRGLSLDWFILRPSLVYGEDGTSTRYFRRLARLPVLPLVSGGEQRIQPVHILDVVDAVLACLSAEPARRTIDLVGPTAMSFAEWLQRLRRQAGRGSLSIIPVPYRLGLLGCRVLGHVVPIMHADNLRMLQQGNTSDDPSMTQLLGRAARDLP